MLKNNIKMKKNDMSCVYMSEDEISGWQWDWSYIGIILALGLLIAIRYVWE